MLEKIPTDDELRNLVGEDGREAWTKVVRFIGEHYEMETSWDTGRKAGVYEHKFRRSGKTLCALYARETASASWSSLGRRNGRNSRPGARISRPRYEKSTPKPTSTTTANG